MTKSMKSRVGLLFAAPSIIGFMIFFAIPFSISIIYSFMDHVGSFDFVGLKNYIELGQSQSFILAVRNTFRFIIWGVPLMVLISLSITLLFSFLMKKGVRYTSLFLTSTVSSMVIPSAAIILFIQILFERYGVLNHFLIHLQKEPVDWLRSPWAFYILLLLFLWKNCSYGIIVFLGSLGQIDEGIYEAAELDGANPWQKFRYITIIYLIPSLFFVIIMGVMGIFKMFRESYLLVGDYPHLDTYMLQNFMNNNLMNLNYQRLSTASILFFLGISGLVFILFGINNKERG